MEFDDGFAPGGRVNVAACFATTVRRIDGELRWWCDTHDQTLVTCNPKAEPMTYGGHDSRCEAEYVAGGYTPCGCSEVINAIREEIDAIRAWGHLPGDRIISLLENRLRIRAEQGSRAASPSDGADKKSSGGGGAETGTR